MATLGRVLPGLGCRRHVLSRRGHSCGATHSMTPSHNDKGATGESRWPHTSSRSRLGALTRLSLGPLIQNRNGSHEDDHADDSSAAVPRLRSDGDGVLGTGGSNERRVDDTEDGLTDDEAGGQQDSGALLAVDIASGVCSPLVEHRSGWSATGPSGGTCPCRQPEAEARTSWWCG